MVKKIKMKNQTIKVKTTNKEQKMKKKKKSCYWPLWAFVEMPSFFGSLTG